MSTTKERIVHYDRLKPYFEKPVASKVSSRNTNHSQPDTTVHSNVPTQNNNLKPETSRKRCMPCQQPPLQPVNLHSPPHQKHQTTLPPQSNNHNAQSRPKLQLSLSSPVTSVLKLPNLMATAQQNHIPPRHSKPHSKTYTK